MRRLSRLANPTYLKHFHLGGRKGAVNVEDQLKFCLKSEGQVPTTSLPSLGEGALCLGGSLTLGGETEGSSAVQPLWADRMKPMGTGRSAPQAGQRACAVLHGTSGWCRASRGSPSKRRMDVVPPTTVGSWGALEGKGGRRGK